MTKTKEGNVVHYYRSADALTFCGANMRYLPPLTIPDDTPLTCFACLDMFERSEWFKAALVKGARRR